MKPKSRSGTVYLRDGDKMVWRIVLWMGRLMVAVLVGRGLWSALSVVGLCMDSATASARVSGHDVEHVQVRVESKVSGSRSIPIDIYNLELEFVDGTGATCYAEVSGNAILGTDPDRVPIRYSRSMPTRAVVSTVIGLWGEAAIFLGLGLLLAAVVELALR